MVIFEYGRCLRNVMKKCSVFIMLKLGLDKMFKFLGCILKLFLSILLLFSIGIFSAFVAPYFTAESYEGNATPDGLFLVLVEINDSENNQTTLRPVRWNEYSEKINNYKAYRSPSEGNCYNSPLWCRAKNIDPGKQLIELRDHQENYFLYNKYYVTNEKIIPLYSRIMDPGHAMLGFFISIIMTPIALLCFRFYRRRFKNYKAKSNNAVAADS